jgi:HlyD family secretion protein
MIRDTTSTDRPLAPAAPGRRRAVTVAVAALAVVVLGAAALPAARRVLTMPGGVSVRLDRLSLGTVERGPFLRDLQAEGQVVAASSPTLFAPDAGTVTLLVHAGDRVAKDQVLATIDSPALRARLAQELATEATLKTDVLRAGVDASEQRAALERTEEDARIDVQAAETDLARQTRAFEAGAAAGMQVDRAKDTLQKARIALAHAQSGLHLKDDSLKFDVQAKQQALARQSLLVQDVKRQVDALQVRSPVDGQVGQLMVDERASTAKDAKLLTVIDLGAFEVQTRVPESFARELSAGMPGEISVNGQVFHARVGAISPEVVESQVAARLRFDGAMPPQLRQNQRLSVRLVIDRRDNVLSVAAGRFVDESGGAAAYVLRDGVAERRAVRLGARGVDRVEIVDGLREGDRVVIGGAEAFQGAARVVVSQ